MLASLWTCLLALSVAVIHREAPVETILSNVLHCGISYDVIFIRHNDPVSSAPPHRVPSSAETSKSPTDVNPRCRECYETPAAGSKYSRAGPETCPRWLSQRLVACSRLEGALLRCSDTLILWGRQSCR